MFLDESADLLFGRYLMLFVGLLSSDLLDIPMVLGREAFGFIFETGLEWAKNEILVFFVVVWRLLSRNRIKSLV